MGGFAVYRLDGVCERGISISYCSIYGNEIP